MYEQGISLKSERKTHDLNHNLTFSAHTINCVCHSIRSMFRVLGMFNFAQSSEFSFIEQLNRGVSGSTLGFKSKSDHHLMRVIFIAGVRKLKALVRPF